MIRIRNSNRNKFIRWHIQNHLSTKAHQNYYINGRLVYGSEISFNRFIYTLTGQKYFNSNELYSNIQTASSIILFVDALPWLFT